MTALVYEDHLLLHALLLKPQSDDDTASCRVLVNNGWAERFAGEGGWTMLRLTEAGRPIAEAARA